MPIDIFAVVIILGVFVLAFWAITKYAPTDPPIRTIMLIVVLLFFLWWLASLIGMTGPLQFRR